jgi:hypothetical protein
MYFLGIRYHIPFPTPLFFICLGTIIATILYQCLGMRLDRQFTLIILAEIAIANFVFHLIFQMSGYGLYGSDSYLDLSTLKSVLSTGFITPAPQFRQISEFSQLTYLFPMLHILAGQLSIVTGIGFLDSAKWFPSIFDLAVVPFIFLMIRDLFKQEKVALISVLLFVVLQHHMLYSSLFIRETIGLVFAICCLYFYFSANNSTHPVLYRCLSILFLLGVVFAHHLTSLMLIILLLTHLLVTYLTRLPSLKGIYQEGKVSGQNITLSFFLIAVLATAIYWVSHVIFTVEYMASFLRDLISINLWGQHTYLEFTGVSNVRLPSLRYYFLIYGSYFCFITFGLLILQRLIFNFKQLQKEFYAFSIFLYLCAFAGVLFTFFLPRTIIGDRFLMYGWLFGFGPLLVAIFQLKRKWLQQFSIAVVAIYIFINLFTIHPALWNPEGVVSSPMPSQEDYSMANTMNFSRGSILSTSNELMTVYDIQNKAGMDAFSLNDYLKMTDFRWIIVNSIAINQSEGMFSRYTVDAVSAMRNLNAKGDINKNRIYESKTISIYKQR